MAACVDLQGGAIVVTARDVQPDQCTAFVLLTPAEANTFPPLTIKQGFEISSAIAVVWAIAWGFKMIRRTL